MDQIATGAFAFLMGLTLCGIAGSLLEAAAGARLSFTTPFFDRLHRVRFAVAVVTAGPFMLCNDAVEAWRAGRLEAPAFAGCTLTALIWTMAIGTSLVAGLTRIVA